MKTWKGPSVLLFLLLLGTTLWLSCNKWNLKEIGFLYVDTGEVVSRTFTSVTVESVISGLPDELDIDRHGLVFSYSNSEPTIEDEVKDQGIRSEDGEFQTTLSDLTVDAPVFLRAFAISDAITNYGEVISVEPEPLGLEIRMDSVQVDDEGIRLFGYLKSVAQGLSFPNIGFVWGTNPQPTVEDGNADYLGPLLTGELIMQGELPNPEPLETYYVRAFVFSGPNKIYSSEELTVSKGNIWRLVGEFPAEDRNPPRYSFVIEDELYIGFDQEFGKYNPENHTWTVLNTDHPNSGIQAVFSLGQEGIVSTDFDSGQGNMKYNITANTWTQIGDFPIQFNPSIGFSMDGKGYMGIATNENANGAKNIYQYDPQTEEFDLETTYPASYRVSTVIFEFGDSTCFTIGHNDLSTSVDCYSYSPSNGWREIAAFPRPVNCEPLYHFTIGHRGYIILPDDVNNFWEYNSHTDVWTQRPDYPGGARGGVAFSANGKGYFGMGQLIFSQQYNTEIWEYIPDPE